MLEPLPYPANCVAWLKSILDFNTPEAPSVPRYKLEIANHFHTESQKNSVHEAGLLGRKS